MSKKTKILVAYHKPAELLKSEIFVPIHVGREIMLEKNKDGNLSKKSRNWMLKNLIGDNTGENISQLNRFFNEMSAVYWGWKNQAALENPDYIGLMHYRRHFIFSEISCEDKIPWLNNSPVFCFESINKKYKKILLMKLLLKNCYKHMILFAVSRMMQMI